MILQFYVSHLIVLLSPLCAITRPWTAENINNNRPGYIILEPATFLTQAIQIQISLLIFIFSVAERKSKVSRIFVPWQPPVLLLSSVVVACFVLFSCDAAYGGNMVHFPRWFPGTKRALVICICRMFFISGKVSSILPCLLSLLRLTLTVPWRHQQSSVLSLPHLFYSLQAFSAIDRGFFVCVVNIAVLIFHKVISAIHCFQWDFNSSIAILVSMESTPNSACFLLGPYPYLILSPKLAIFHWLSGPISRRPCPYIPMKTASSL